MSMRYLEYAGIFTPAVRKALSQTLIQLLSWAGRGIWRGDFGTLEENSCLNSNGIFAYIRTCIRICIRVRFISQKSHFSIWLRERKFKGCLQCCLPAFARLVAKHQPLRRLRWGGKSFRAASMN